MNSATAMQFLSRPVRLTPWWSEQAARRVLLVVHRFQLTVATVHSTLQPSSLGAVLATRLAHAAVRVVLEVRELAAAMVAQAAMAALAALAAAGVVVRVVMPAPAAKAATATVAVIAMQAAQALVAQAAVDAEAAPLLSPEALAVAPPLVVKERQAQEPLQPQGSLVLAALEA